MFQKLLMPSENFHKSLTSISGKVILVTGAGRGNGKAIADGLENSGAVVIRVDNSYEETPDSNELRVDLKNLNQLKGLVELVVEKYSRVDGLVNNAGISLPFNPEAYDLDYFQDTLTVNLIAATLLSIETCKVMRNQSGGGSIVNILSLGAFLGFSQNPAYQISKAGLGALTRSIAKDWGIYGIRANNVVPGYFKTAMTEHSFRDDIKRREREEMTLLKRWGRSEDLVGPVSFLLSDMSSYVTGSDLVVDGGWLSNGGIM
jgi:NAD(P)-dependent dehydrogenase (short-subunit alcohol dehydrogenase family)